MHQAMHDAANAVSPRYVRWTPATPDEPSGQGASTEAAIANAAKTVLTALHPGSKREIDAVYDRAIGRLQRDTATDRGIALGQTIGQAAVARRANDGFSSVRPFVGSTAVGRWRPAPPDFKTSDTTDARPFLFETREWPGARPPPMPLSPAATHETIEARDLGGEASDRRTADQAAAAKFWAFQSSQRGFMLLAVRQLYAHPQADGLVGHARIMSQFASAMADSAILTWAEKERYSSWRPITVIRGGYGVPADAAWSPMIETPEHPEYPSGHASDCYTGASVLDGVFNRAAIGPVVYIAPGEASAPTQAPPLAMTMGLEMQAGARPADRRVFDSFDAIAEECAASRIWAGAHFAAARDEFEASCQRNRGTRFGRGSSADE